MTGSRALRFAPSTVGSTTYANTVASSICSSYKIANICQAIYGCFNTTGHVSPIGHISDGQYTHDFQLLKAGAGNLELHSLEELLLASISASGNFHTSLVFPKNHRRFLAAKLASTVLECHGNWLPSRWSSRNIMFTGNIASTEIEKTVQTPVIVRKISSPAEFEGYPLCWAGYNDLLFPLGLVLIELSLGRTITCLYTPSDGDQDEIPTLFEKCGPNYGDVVQQCLFWTKTREVDIESEEFQAAVFQYIIKPLVEDFNQFNDS
ncbi:hypothetical protein N7490_000311 [Penicillium lividum]|nr:hypothetical protein N7490_000311 [Penicillium lividum]